jgi:hypothetical protein
MKVQFANGKVFEGADIDDAIAQCLASGNDPFNPVVVKEEPKQYTKKTKENADTVEQ